MIMPGDLSRLTLLKEEESYTITMPGWQEYTKVRWSNESIGVISEEGSYGIRRVEQGEDREREGM